MCSSPTAILSTKKNKQKNTWLGVRQMFPSLNLKRRKHNTKFDSHWFKFSVNLIYTSGVKVRPQLCTKCRNELIQIHLFPLLRVKKLFSNIHVFERRWNSTYSINFTENFTVYNLTCMCRFSRLISRKTSLKKINKKIKINLSVNVLSVITKLMLKRTPMRAGRPGSQGILKQLGEKATR